MKDAMAHSGELGAGAAKRRKMRLRPREKVSTVMREFYRKTLHSGSGQIVTNPAQAKAIAMSEAGMAKKSKYKKMAGGSYH